MGESAEKLSWQDVIAHDVLLPPRPVTQVKRSALARYQTLRYVLFAVVTILQLVLLWTIDSSPIAMIPYALLNVLIGYYYVNSIVRIVRNNRQWKKAELTPIGEATPGLVKIKGRARHLHDLYLPDTAIPAVYYRRRRFAYAIGVRHPTGKNLMEEITTEDNPFLVEDETGAMLVDPRRAKINLPSKRHVYPEDSVADFFTKGWDWEEIDFLEDGEMVYVIGFVQTVDDDQSPREALKRIMLRELKQNPAKRSAYDRNGDNRLDENEWEAARRDAQAQAAIRAADFLMIGKPPLWGMLHAISTGALVKYRMSTLLLEIGHWFLTLIIFTLIYLMLFIPFFAGR